VLLEVICWLAGNVYAIYGSLLLCCHCIANIAAQSLVHQHGG